MRVVRDDDVDRAQVYRRRRHSRALLIARNFRLWGVVYPGPSVLFRLVLHVRFFDVIQVAMARRFHLFPFRTEKLSSVTPMVLRKRESR